MNLRTGIILRLILVIIIITTLIWLVAKIVDPNELWNTLITYPPRYFIVALCLALLFSVLKGFRLWLLLRNLSVHSSVVTFIRLFLASQIATPFPGGEVYRIALIRKETGGARISTIAGAIISHSYVDLMSAAFIATILAFFITPYGSLGIVFLLLFACITFFLTIKTAAVFVGSLTSFFPTAFQKAIVSGFESFQKGLAGTNVKKQLLIFAIAALTHLLGGLILWGLAQPLSLSSSLVLWFFMFSAGVIVQQMTAFVPGGLGFTEGALLGLLLLFGESAVHATTLAILFRAVTFIFPIFVGGFVSLIFYRDVITFKRHSLNTHNADTRP